MAPRDLGIIADRTLNSFGLAKGTQQEGALPIPDRAKDVLRKRLLPAAFALSGHSMDASGPQTPQALIAEVVKRKEAFNLTPDLVASLGKYIQPGATIDWKEEVDEISDPDHVHPLTELADQVTQHLSPGARAALALASL